MAARAAKSNSPDTEAPLDGEILPDATTIEVGAATMLGDLRNPILDAIRLMPKAWPDLKAHEQQRVVTQVERICREAITGMVGLFSAMEIPSVEILIGAMSAKDETLTVKISCDKTDDAALALLNNPRAMLVFADAKSFMGEREAAKIDPDQPNIPFPEGAPDRDAETVAERETAPGGMPLDEAEKAFERSKEAAEEKKVRQRQRRATTMASEPEPAQEEGETEIPVAPREPVEA